MYVTELTKLGINLNGKHFGQIKTVCPKCSHLRKKKKDFCLQVNIDSGVYKCWNCEWKGSVHSYVRPTELPLVVTDKLYGYFQSRCISKETVDKFKITRSKEWMPQTQKEEWVMCFPYERDGELINIKFRDNNKNFKLVKDAEKIPFNLDSIKNQEYAIFGEGEIEPMSWYEIGLTSAVSCPNGASKGTNNLSWLDTCYDDFIDKKIYIASDNDEPGLSLRDDLIRRFDSSLIFLITFPPDCKDGNDTLKLHGRDGLKKCFDEAKPVNLEFISTVDDCDLDEIYENGYPKGETIGYGNFDSNFSITRGLFGVVTGVPGSGKSTFLKQYCLRLAIRKSWKIATFGFEESNSLAYTRLIEQFIGKPLNGLNKMNRNEFTAAKNALREMMMFYKIDKLQDFQIDTMLGLMLNMIRRYGIDLFVIDPFNYIERDDSETDTIGEVLKKINLFTKKYKASVILVAHPRKMGTTQKGYDVPSLYDIAGSHHFFNIPDFGWTVHRFHEEGINNAVSVHILKLKQHFLGNSPREIPFEYDKDTGRYKEPGCRWEAETIQTQNNLI